MHGGVKPARYHGGADFGHEGATLAAMDQELAGLVGIACGLELDDLDVQLGCCDRQALRNILGLGERHGALARAYPHCNCHYRRSIPQPRWDRGARGD
jgi:hypothetical protein